MRKSKSKRIILTILCVVFAALFLFSSYKIVSKLIEYAKGERTYEDLAELVTVRSDEHGSEVSTSPG